MSQPSEFFRKILKQATLSSASTGICYLEITAQYIYGNSNAGLYTGTVTPLVQASENYPENWIIPSSGVLRYGSEASTKANLVFVSKVAEGESVAFLTSADGNIKHYIQNFKFEGGGMFTAAIKGGGKETGRVTINYNLVTLPWPL